MHQLNIRRKPCNRLPLRPKSCDRTTQLMLKKIPLYLVLKGSKFFFGAFGAEKHPYTLYFRFLLRFYALLVQLWTFLAQNGASGR